MQCVQHIVREPLLLGLLEDGIQLGGRVGEKGRQSAVCRRDRCEIAGALDPVAEVNEVHQQIEEEEEECGGAGEDSLCVHA